LLQVMSGPVPPGPDRPLTCIAIVLDHSPSPNPGLQATKGADALKVRWLTAVNLFGDKPVEKSNLYCG
jgi:hypothetical protein